jgi:acetyltransferase-like isoleucine patch superfamily enzyme
MKLPNIDLFLKKLTGRATCVKGSGTQVLPAASIRNAQKRNASILIGKRCIIEGELFVFAHGGEIEIGDWCYVGPNSRIWSGCKITIGNRVLISHGVNIFDNLTHPIDPEARHKQFVDIYRSGHPAEIDLDDRPVSIGDDCWLGAGCIVGRGVTLGEGAIVGAGSVITKDVPPFTIVAGNPARIIRQVYQDIG